MQLGGQVGAQIGAAAATQPPLPALPAQRPATPTHFAPARKDPDPVVAFRFNVVIDGLDMGSFTSCEGLGVEYEVLDHQEGGQLGSTIHLLGKKKFTNIKLTRAMDQSTTKVETWFGSATQRTKRSTGQITALTPDGKPVRTWNIVDVVPVRWTGPQFKADGNSVVTESLELAHHGFY